MLQYPCKEDKAYGSADIYEMDQRTDSHSDYFVGGVAAGLHMLHLYLGVPSFVVQRVEQALLEKGIPSHIETLKVTLWPRAVVTLKNVELLDPEAMPETRRPIVLLHEADVALNWKN